MSIKIRYTCTVPSVHGENMQCQQRMCVVKGWSCIARIIRTHVMSIKIRYTCTVLSVHGGNMQCQQRMCVVEGWSCIARDMNTKNLQVHTNTQDTHAYYGGGGNCVKNGYCLQHTCEISKYH